MTSLLTMHDEEVMELAESISDWEPADPTDQEMMSAFGTRLARRISDTLIGIHY